MKRIAGALLSLALVTGFTLPALADQPSTEVDKTCKDLAPFGENREASESGEWGSIVFSDQEDTLTLVVNEGFEVVLCVKAGSANQGLGPENAGTFEEGTYEVGHSSGKDLSHFDLLVIKIEEPPSETTTTTIPETTSSSEGTTTTTEPSTTTVPVTEPTLPFTGPESQLIPLAVILLASGSLMLAATRRPSANE